VYFFVSGTAACKNVNCTAISFGGSVIIAGWGRVNNSVSTRSLGLTSGWLLVFGFLPVHQLHCKQNNSFQHGYYYCQLVLHGITSFVAFPVLVLDVLVLGEPQSSHRSLYRQGLSDSIPTGIVSDARDFEIWTVSIGPCQILHCAH